MRPVSRGRVQPIPDSSLSPSPARRPSGEGVRGPTTSPRGTGDAEDAPARSRPRRARTPGWTRRTSSAGNRAVVEALAERLLRDGTMTGDDVADFVNGWSAEGQDARRAAGGASAAAHRRRRLDSMARHLAARAMLFRDAGFSATLNQRPLRGRAMTSCVGPRREGGGTGSYCRPDGPRRGDGLCR